MPHIAGQVTVAAPPQEVFDVVADSRNEPSFNPAMRSVELLTPEPIGIGTRFRAHMGRAGTPMLVELTEFQRPYRLGSRTTGPLMDTVGTLSFAASDGGTVMSWAWEVQPKGWLRLLGPLVGPLGSRMERGIWSNLKDFVERGHRGPPSTS